MDRLGEGCPRGIDGLHGARHVDKRFRSSKLAARSVGRRVFVRLQYRPDALKTRR